MFTWPNLLVLLMMIAGTVGIIVPILPGLMLTWVGTVVWALFEQSTTGWVVFGIATVLYAASLAAQILFPGRRMKQAGVRTWALAVALIAAVVGIFVIPLFGAPIGFVGAIFLLELAKHRQARPAWEATKVALKAVLVNMGIELGAAMAIILTWGVGVFLSR